MKLIRNVTLGMLTLAVSFTLPATADNCTASKDTAATCTAKKDLVATAIGAEQFKTLVAALKAADLVEVLQGDGPFTVFAPTDAAFAKLPAGTVESLLKPENKAQLVAILKYHVVSGKVLAADVKTGDAKTVNGQTVHLKVSGNTVTVNNANVVKADVLAENGVIHVIDTVILPTA